MLLLLILLNPAAKLLPKIALGVCRRVAQSDNRRCAERGSDCNVTSHRIVLLNLARRIAGTGVCRNLKMARGNDPGAVTFFRWS
jgi:hypothetical protein